MKAHRGILTDYSSTLGADPFLFFETRTVASLILKGFDRTEIQKKVQAENPFQYQSLNRIPKRVNVIYRRIADLDPEILQRLVEGESSEAKMIVLLAIARSDRLFAEFLVEVFHEKISDWNPVLKQADMILFFETKSEHNPKVASWSDNTVQKLREVYFNILVGAGLMKNREEREVQKALPAPEFRQMLLRSFSKELIRAIEG